MRHWSSCAPRRPFRRSTWSSARSRCSVGRTAICFQPSLAEIGREILRDPWGHPYVYTPFLPTTSNPPGQSGSGNGNGSGGGNGGGPPAPPGTIEQARKNRFLVPINSDFDLFSPGPDGDWVGPLTAQESQDDILRANNGDFVGPAWKD
jgi:general secretion pathway protein G